MSDFESRKLAVGWLKLGCALSDHFIHISSAFFEEVIVAVWWRLRATSGNRLYSRPAT